jgi:signal transduction histidine kinase
MPAEPKVNILLVDDNASNLLALEAMLDGPGLNLVRARSGEEALRRLLEEDFALILMDVQMPGMDGFEAAELVRGRERCRHVPIIFLTAFADGEVQAFRGYSLGAVDFLFKPIVPEVLRSKVAVFVELFRKTEQVRRQAEQLRETQHREHQRLLLEEQRRWEIERLRATAAEEKRTAERLAEADRRKDEFLAMLGHELRNPLAALLNSLHLLGTVAPGDVEAEQAREIAGRQARHLKRLVDDLLDVSRITNGKIQLQTAPVDLRGVVDRAVETARPLIDAGDLQLSVSLPDGPVPMEADAARLEQVFANLLSNAAKYTEPGGRIAVEAALEGDQAVVRVRDTGIGIAPELLPRVFDLFAQAERSLDRSQGGLGIGLTLVRRLVELHGGSVAALSAGTGLGSEFVVRLPATPPNGQHLPQVPSGDPAAPHAEERSRRRVLVVDDNVDAAVVMAKLLRRRGHEVEIAHDGPQAVVLAQDHPPDVILLDIGLPGMDGYEVARVLRGSVGLECSLLVALTGYGQEEHRRKAQDAGMDLHLTKPVDPRELEDLLSRHAGPIR